MLITGSSVAALPKDSSDVVRLTTQLSQEFVRPGETFELTVLLALEPGWHVNAHSPRSKLLIPTTLTFVENPAIRLERIRYPHAVRRKFAFAEETLDVYEGEVRLLTQASLAEPAVGEQTVILSGHVRLQACSETVCLAPATLPVQVSIPMSQDGGSVMPLRQGGDRLQGQSSLPLPSGGWLEGLLHSQALWLWFVAAFLGGLALNLTPCVYPMIPVTLAFFSGQRPGRMGYTATLGAFYVCGMSITYALLGLLAAKSGALFGSWLQQPAVLIGVAVLVGVLALGMFGLYELRPPAWLSRRFGQASSGRGGALVMGLTVGVIAAPCIGPFILGLLVFVSQLANPWLGFSLLFTVGVGMGVPYVLLGIFANRISHLPKAGAWLVWTKKLLGVGLLGLGLYFLRPLVPPLMFQWISVVCLVTGGVYLGWLERSQFRGYGIWIRRAVGLGLFVGAVVLMPARQGSAVPSVSWIPYNPARLEQAAQEGRPVLIDIYADWCPPCVELDLVTFRHPDVVERLAGFVSLRVDATVDTPPEAEGLLDRYQVFGVPTVLLFDAGGRERSDIRINGFIPPAEMVRRLEVLRP